MSDYTWAIANELCKLGDDVHVIAPGPVEIELPTDVHVHRLGSRFGLKSIRELDQILARLPKPHCTVLQFVPQSFGWRGVNLPFMLWLRRLRGYPLWVMFHEFAIKDDAHMGIARRIQALGTRIAAKIAASSADKLFVSTAAWRPLVEAAAPGQRVVELAVPSAIPIESDATRVAAIRAQYCPNKESDLIGHFGTYRMAETVNFLRSAISALCTHESARHALIMGRGSDRFCQETIKALPMLAGRLHGTGGLAPQDLANHLSACDVVLQPYEDGVSSRRSSLIAALGLGIPTVTTHGQSTEKFWIQSGAVVMVDSFDVLRTTAVIEDVLADAERRQTLASNAKKLYFERFELSMIVAKLRER